MTSKGPVQRPLKRCEHEVRFGNRDAEKGWRDLLAVARNATTDAWDNLSSNPHERSQRCYPLQADYEHVLINGVQYAQWQYKVTDGGRIWFSVVPSDMKVSPPPKVAGVVYLLLCSPGHPKGTE